MNTNAALNDPSVISAATTKAQSDAANPAASAWVSASAGTGKTHVLTQRVLRLLLSGTRAERILCLTYTKAAAAEMSTRIFGELGHWVTYDDARLHETLQKLLGRPPVAAETGRARTLFAEAIETPGGLKVQTIHSFSERLLQRFPLEAGVAPGFEILDDVTARALLREAIDQTLATGARAPASPLGEALTVAVAHAVDDSFDAILGEALSRRDWIETLERLPPAPGAASGEDAIAAARPHYLAAFGLARDASADKIATAVSGLVSDAWLARACTVLAGGGINDNKMAAALAEARSAIDPTERRAALARALLTKGGKPRSDKQFVSKAIRTSEPGLADQLARARDDLADIQQQTMALDVVEATLALIRIAGSVQQNYATLKARRASLDYDDLIRRAANLLNGNHAAPWVLFKLDGGIDHILVDESQDTSPEQWRIVEALANEFFSGSGTHDQTPTLFAVGDEKQSIYSFQGARPEQFARMGDRFRRQAAAASARWHDITLHLSFRTVAPVLETVDRVFADARVTPGLLADASGTVRHAANRIGQSGLVEIWETETPTAVTAPDIWSPVGDDGSNDRAAEGEGEGDGVAPAVRVANRIADKIRRLIDGGERLASADRPIRAGDIIILVRKRNPFAEPMVAALKARRIPVAGADRLRLIEQIAVQDLMVLCDFLTLPEDDLALATTLKSPLFGFDDDLLMQIAHDRKGSLWTSMLDVRRERGSRPEIDAAASLLRDWRRRADFLPPYEFLAGLLDRDGMRKRLLARLGSEAADSIDELLTLALQYDEDSPPSMTGFLAWLRQSNREIKRDMEHGRDEVRIMTVHGAKGLEAPIVFLPDTCTTKAVGRRPSLVSIDLARKLADAPEAFAWAIKGTGDLATIAAGKQRHEARETEERNRLLYVAMTRARDRLYIAGFEGRNPRPADCWYDLVANALADQAEHLTDEDGRPIRRLMTPQTHACDERKKDLATAHQAVPLADWARETAPREPQLSIPIAPSRLAPYDVDEAGEPVNAPPPPPGAGDEPGEVSPRSATPSDSRFLRGTLTHALLQHLPGLPVSARPEAARAFVERRGREIPAGVRKSIVNETLAILETPGLAPLFGPVSRAEVQINAELPRTTGRGPPLRLSGQIDRLAIDGDSVLIIDYKTNRPAPVDVGLVADAYLFQLAAYRLALAKLFPDKVLRAAIVWTDGPRMMAIPDEIIARYEQRLWDLDTARLDGM